MEDNQKPIDIKFIYEQAAAKHEWMVEWRYKILTRYYVSTGALLLVSSWLYKEQDLRSIFFVPIVLATVNSFLFFVMNRRNKELIDACANVAMELEKNYAEVSGIFFRWHKENKWPPSYDAILATIYLGSAGILAMLIAYFVFRGLLA